MAKYLYDKDNKYSGKILSHEEHREEQRMNNKSMSELLDDARSSRLESLLFTRSLERKYNKDMTHLLCGLSTDTKIHKEERVQIEKIILSNITESYPEWKIIDFFIGKKTFDINDCWSLFKVFYKWDKKYSGIIEFKDRSKEYKRGEIIVSILGDYQNIEQYRWNCFKF